MIDVRVSMCLCCLTTVLCGIRFVEGFKMDLTDLKEGSLNQVAGGARTETDDGLMSEDNEVTEEETYHLTSFRQRKPSKKKDMFSKLLPMFIIPYLVQSAILPMILMSMKAMLLKSFLVGKLAILLGLFNALRTRSNHDENYQGHSEEGTMQHIVKQHYGYHGNEEFGAYIHH